MFLLQIKAPLGQGTTRAMTSRLKEAGRLIVVSPRSISSTRRSLLPLELSPSVL